MSPKKTSGNGKRQPKKEGISAITIKGYKSICQEQRLEIRPLTILAGANSSGKSSVMQPLLLLKQTLEASYDPGALLLNGPNIRFTSADQLLSRMPNKKCTESFTIMFESSNELHLSLMFQRMRKKGFKLFEMKFNQNNGELILREDLSDEELIKMLPEELKKLHKDISKMTKEENIKWNVIRDRCFLGLKLKGAVFFPGIFSPVGMIEPILRRIIHLPGLRGNPERTYKTTAVGDTFPGVFQEYVASIVHSWKNTKDEKLDVLSNDLKKLELTWKIESTQIDDTQVELKVGRLLHPSKGGAYDFVNITDVGFGVSQALPVVVALLVAKPGQIVYLEQPEIHLHPRAQVAMAELLSDAAKRGVIVVAETHSDNLLLGVQALVAEGKLDKDRVKLHWFERGSNGFTKVIPANLDETGAFGDWPEDFGSVEMELQRRYLDAPFKKREPA